MSLQKIDPGNFDIELDIAYATADNIAGKAVYAVPEFYLIQAAADALGKAIESAKVQSLKLRIFDGYRPRRVQEYFWTISPDTRYVMDPKVGSNHTRGIAVDLTLQTADGAPLDMGCAFDCLNNLSHPGNMDIPAEAQRNRHILTGIMVSCGWLYNPFEWWHFDLPDPQSYPFIEQGDVVDRLTASWLME